MSFLSQPITLQSLFGEDRSFGPFTADVIISESTVDNLVITKQPVQTGAPITDHAYKEPTTLSMKIRFSGDLSQTLFDIYKALLEFQFPPVPFDVLTPKRVYTDMLISSLGCTTDKYTENVLAIDVSFQQVILVDIVTVQVPLKQQKTPAKTAGTQKSGKKSVIKKTFGGAG